MLPADHPDRYETLDTLARALHFKTEHLVEALQLSQESGSLISPGHHECRQHMMTLATILRRCYECSELIEELQEAASFCEEALSECPPNHCAPSSSTSGPN